MLEAPSSVNISALALLAHYETASAATAISVTAAMHDHVFHRTTQWNPSDRPGLLLIQLHPIEVTT
jgi:hypothetical protein